MKRRKRRQENDHTNNHNNNHKNHHQHPLWHVHEIRTRRNASILSSTITETAKTTSTLILFLFLSITSPFYDSICNVLAETTSSSAIPTILKGTSISHTLVNTSSSLSSSSSTTATTNNLSLHSIIHDNHLPTPSAAASSSYISSSSSSTMADADDSDTYAANMSSTTTNTENSDIDSHPLTSLSTLETIEDVRKQSLELRQEAKKYHDQGYFLQSETYFHQAAKVLQRVISDVLTSSSSQDISSQKELLQQIKDECATCYLHKALCQHKQKKYLLSIQTCTHVLQGNVLRDDDDDEEEEEQGTTKTQNQDDRTHGSSKMMEVSAAIQARAYLRRAKAFYALSLQQQPDMDIGEGEEEDTTRSNTLHYKKEENSFLQSAYQDAKTAAFLGDVNAVSFYGKLMRDSSSSRNGSSTTMKDSDNDSMNQQELSSSNFLKSILSTSSSSPFLNPIGESQFLNKKKRSNEGSWLHQQDATSSSPLSSLFTSSLPFLSSSLSSSSSSSTPDLFSIMNLIRDVMSASSSSSEFPNQSIQTKTSTLFHTLVSTLEKEETQQVLCTYLHSIHSKHIQSIGSLIGIPLESTMIERLVSMAHTITPRAIQRFLVLLKRLVYGGRILWKCLRVLSMYRSLWVYYLMIQFIKRSL